MFFRAIGGGLTPSGPVTVTANNQIIEWLSISASTTGITIGNYTGVIIRNCLIRYNGAGGSGVARGIDALNGSNLTIQDCQIINIGAPQRGALPSGAQGCIYLEAVNGVTISRVTTEKGATGIKLASCTSGSTLSYIENHDSRGPYPGGQAIQWATCTGTHSLNYASDEIVPGTSWPEDSYNVYATPNVTVSNIYVPMSSDGTSGRVFVIEGETSINCAISNLEAGWIYNGSVALAEVPSGSFTDIRVRGANPFAYRNGAQVLAGSSNAGGTAALLVLAAYSVGPYANSVVEIKRDDYPNSNLVFLNTNLTTYSNTEVDWTPTLGPIRNVFPWRPTNRAPTELLPPRVMAGSTGYYGSFLALLPGQYSGHPTSRAWQWYKNGVAISGATGIYTPNTGAGAYRCDETPSNAAGAGAISTASVVVA